MVHPEAVANDLYILGQYQRGPWGSTIVIYYGSFMRLYSYLSREALKEKLEDTLLHEFTHHLEFLASERGLEEKDEIQMAEYRRQKKKGFEK
ncbi:MAG: metallopeptidase family protein [Tissierellia bacterium]|nr:metallopeptidase family protein [Tissierellia bacterium]